MIINLVFIDVKPENREEFLAATLINARESRQESGIARFDVLEVKSEPFKFVLIEAFRDEDAPGKHKETPHYQQWRETVAPMMAGDRKSIGCTGLDITE